LITRIISTLLLLYALGYALFVVSLPGPADDRHTDAIIILTGSAGRMERGLDLLERGKAERMLVSGVDRSVRRGELAARYPKYKALFDCCIDLGREAIDTRSNASEVANWLKRRGISSARLVTTDWHMRRAQFEIAQQVEGDVEFVPDAVQSNPRFRHLFVEYNKYLLRRAAVVVGI
jgi:uncharacterized SAM-binding protein YcdF (DUF218 family)